MSTTAGRYHYGLLIYIHIYIYIYLYICVWRVTVTAKILNKIVKNQGFKTTPLCAKLCLTLTQETFPTSFQHNLSYTFLKHQKKRQLKNSFNS